MLSIFSAAFFDRETEETIPVVTYVFMLLLYLAGIAGVIAHAVELLALYIVSGSVFFAALGIYRNKSAGDYLKSALSKLKSRGIWVFLIFCVLSVAVSMHLRVTNWDDLHYWAIFPKDMYVINGVPTGGMSSTLYQDYFPIVQYLYFTVFKILGHFSEPAMFAVNYILILVSLLPFFMKKKEQKELSYLLCVLFGIILAQVCSYQMYHCLGVDIIMTFLFGSALICIFDEKKDLFYYLRFISVTMVLTMSKTTGLIFAAIAIAVFAVENFRSKPKEIAWILLTGSANLVFYYSWKYFCRIKGNTTYLSNVLNSNIESEAGIVFPSYTKDTVREFVKAFFMKSLNGGVLGLSAFAMLIISLVIYIYLLKKNREKLRRGLELAVLMCGMLGYLAVMLYIYLFVFDEWEALSMSSYDRYIATFFGGILCAAIYFISREDIKKILINAALLIFMAVTVNYPFALDTMIPKRFEEKYGPMVSIIDGLDEELSGVFTDDMHYGDEIIFVDGKDDMARSKSIPYCAVPYVSRVNSLIDRESYTADELITITRDRNAKYVIFLDRSEDEKVRIDNEETLFADGESMETDVLYEYDRERDILVKAE